MYGEVLIKYEVKSLDRTFTYSIPNRLRNIIKVGMKVKVSFGSKKINGFLISINDTYNEGHELKEIIDIVNPDLKLTQEQLCLGKYLRGKTLCSLMTSYEVMLPTGMKANSKKDNYNKYDIYLELNKSNKEIITYVENNKRYNSQVFILKKLLESKTILKRECNLSSVNTLKKKDLIKEVKRKIFRLDKKEEVIINDFEMTKEQRNAFENIKNTFNKTATHLIYGVTGSGKTLVYINLIKEVLKNNKTALLLVPEISLTTQMINKFYGYFGKDVAIFHSGLSIGEKYDEYLKILNKNVRVVVGTRSAIFTPLINLGIIIIDEEHSDTYKQDNNPRYNAKDIALFRSNYHNCPLVLGSATPSLESMARALKKVYNLIEMKTRVNNKLPLVKIVDMNLEMKKRNTIFSDLLKEEISNKLLMNEQIILLLNRRGFSTFINCSDCGYTYKCPHCEISLTYHKTTNNLRCHYCGYTVLKNSKCPHCHSDSLNYYGLGTEKVEQELKSLFKDAKIVRMDADTTTNKGSHEQIIKDFSLHKYDILLGTQMISKGLDFPLVTLVGVINADITLNIPNYKSSEATFSLLNQVAGRSGRSTKEGIVIIQSFNPDNYTLEYVKENNYLRFYNHEMSIRKTLSYPPYVYLVSIKVIGKDYNETSNEATKVGIFLKENLNNNEILLGPTTAAIFKVQNKYHFQLIIKHKNEEKVLEVLKKLDEIYILNKKVYLEIDLNPSRI